MLSRSTSGISVSSRIGRGQTPSARPTMYTSSRSRPTADAKGATSTPVPKRPRRPAGTSSSSCIARTKLPDVSDGSTSSRTPTRLSILSIRCAASISDSGHRPLRFSGGNRTARVDRTHSARSVQVRPTAAGDVSCPSQATKSRSAAVVRCSFRRFPTKASEAVGFSSMRCSMDSMCTLSDVAQPSNPATTPADRERFSQGPDRSILPSGPRSGAALTSARTASRENRFSDDAAVAESTKPRREWTRRPTMPSPRVRYSGPADGIPARSSCSRTVRR